MDNPTSLGKLLTGLHRKDAEPQYGRVYSPGRAGLIMHTYDVLGCSLREAKVMVDYLIDEYNKSKGVRF